MTRANLIFFCLGVLASRFFSNMFAPMPPPAQVKEVQVQVPVPCPPCPLAGAQPLPPKAADGAAAAKGNAAALPPVLPPPPPPPPPMQPLLPPAPPPPPLQPVLPPPAAEPKPLPTPVAALPAPGASAAPHLVIAMNTIPRKSGDEYLTRTLDSLRGQISAPTSPRTDVLVFDPRGNEVHPQISPALT